MLRFCLSLAIAATLSTMTLSVGKAAPHLGSALSRQISSDGPRAVAWRLTLKHGWARVESNIAGNDPSLTSATVRALLDYTPKHEKGAMQQALRLRLQKDPLAGLASLSPISHSPYSGRAVCSAGDARWKHQIRPALQATHDIIFALQREDCLGALKLHSRR